MNLSYRITMSSHKLHGDFSVNKGRKKQLIYLKIETRLKYECVG